MGQAAARKVTEIDEARQRLERDLLELEDRLPAMLRSAKSLVGVLLGLGVTAVMLRRFRSRRSDRSRAAEVVVRIVRDDR
ncbi:MAG TPA: hypothetical protein VJN50_06270 [Actinomycetota bacterium]|nr:hypothetical protein [Actinomycetota bacterium]